MLAKMHASLQIVLQIAESVGARHNSQGNARSYIERAISLSILNYASK